MHASGGDDRTLSKQLTFRLADEAYGLDIQCVRDIRRWSRVTRIPQAPDYMPGVLNLRGMPVPVLDLRLRFGLERSAYDADTVVIVVVVDGRPFGLVVDAVSDVLDIDPEKTEPVPDMGSIVDARCLKGLADGGEHMVMLLDPEKLVCLEAMETSEKAGAAPAGAHDVEATDLMRES